MTFAVQGIPRKWSLKQVRTHFEVDFPDLFKPLYFDFESKFKKMVYIQILSDSHDPVDIVREINTIPRYKQKPVKLNAIIPKYISEAHMAVANKVKVKSGPKTNSGPGNGPKTNIGAGNAPKTKGNVKNLDKIMVVTHKEIMTELQAKYTTLYGLSRKTPGNALLEEIARTVFERLNSIVDKNEEASTSSVKLSGYYRKLHPHFGDFQMILSTLHKIQDQHGLPRTQLVESEMATASSKLRAIDNIPFEKVQAATYKYSARIAKRVLEHVKELDSKPHQMDTNEDVARKRVRAELKNMSQHLPSIIKLVIQKHMTPLKVPFHRVRIYGEPFLPTKEVIAPFLRRYKAVQIERSDRMYNLLEADLPPDQYKALVAKDGASLGGAKLVIRSSDIPLYRVPDSLIAEIKAACGISLLEEDAPNVKPVVKGEVVV